MKNKIYLAVLKVTQSGKGSYQVFVVNRKSKKAIEEQIRHRYKIGPDTTFRFVSIIASNNDNNDKIGLILSRFNFIWGQELFNKKGEDSYRVGYLDHLLCLVYFYGLKQMHTVMQKLQKSEVESLKKTVNDLRSLVTDLKKTNTT